MSAIDGRVLLQGRVVDENIEATQLVGRLRHEAPAERLGPQIAGNGDGLAPLRLDQGDHFLRVRLFGRQVVDGNVGPSRAYAMAAARPMPLSPPVISAFLPASLPEPL